MRYVQIPADIEVHIKNGTAPDTVRPTTFFNTMNEVWLNHAQVFGASGAGIRTSAKLEGLFADRKPGDWVQVEDADFALLEKAMETSSYNPLVARQLVPFMNAILEARKVKPE